MQAKQINIFDLPKEEIKKEVSKNNTIISLENKKILKRYRMYCKSSKGFTIESLKAICDNDLRLFIEFIGEKPLYQITHENILDFLAYCEEERKNHDQALSRKFTSLNTFFNRLIVQEVLDMKNPLRKLEKPKVRKKYRGHLTLEEYQQLLYYIDSINDLRGGAIVSLFFSSACRLSEIWQLNRESLDFESRKFKVLGKGQKQRGCVFSEDAKERVLKYLATRNDDLEALFMSRQKNRWSRKAIQDFVKVVAKRADIKKDISPHWLRHTRAMTLLRKDVPLEVIQRLLGHESIATTQVYARMDMDSVQSKVDEIDSNI